MYLKPNQMHEYLTPAMEIVSVDPNFIYSSPLSMRLFENNLNNTSSESSDSGSSESTVVVELPLFNKVDQVLHQQQFRIDEQFDLAAYITGTNSDFNYLQSPSHSESDTFDYVDRWLDDCLKEDIPTESIEAIVWSNRECDLNVLVKESSFEPKPDLKTASDRCNNFVKPVKSICMTSDVVNSSAKSVGIGRGKNLSMFIKKDHHDSSCDSASDKSTVDIMPHDDAINHANEDRASVPKVNCTEHILAQEHQSYVEVPPVPVLSVRQAKVPDVKPVIRLPVKPLPPHQSLPQITESIQLVASIKTESLVPMTVLPQRLPHNPESEFSSTQVSTVAIAATNKSNNTSDSNDGSAQVTESKENQIKKKRRLNLDEYLKRRRGHKENLNDCANRKVNDEQSAIKLETVDPNVIGEDVKPNIDALNLEEIIIVSMGTNTDISIPPYSQYTNDVTNNSDLSHIFKSNYLFDINDTIIKANGENVKISNNSLIASIQDVLLKKCKPNGGMVTGTGVGGSTVKGENGHVAVEMHGEDKTIMHLRKDRMRVATKNVCVQTDCLLMFPVLQKSIDSGRSSMRDSMTKYSDSGDRHRDRSIENDHKRPCSTDSDSSLSSPHKSRRYGGSSRSPSYNKKYKYYKKPTYMRKQNYGCRQDFLCRSDSDSSQSENSRILHYSYSDAQSKYNFHKNNNDQHSNHQRKNIEERRIVYVGRIEKLTTRDDLKNKFIMYGPIKQITMHQKENGMKFGFVTYENASDAYRAIDSSSGDATINMYDISFGGRRAFCKATYMDLDGSIACQSTFAKSATPKTQPDSYEELLKKMKEKLCQKRTLGSP